MSCPSAADRRHIFHADAALHPLHAPSPPKAARASSAMPPSEPISAEASTGSIQDLLVGRLGELAERLRVLVGSRETDLSAWTSPFATASDTIDVALASASARRSRASASRKAASRRPSACSTCACFSPSAFRMADWRKPSASRICALFALSLHLPGHGRHEVGRRVDVLDFHAGDLDAPGLGRGVDHVQQAGVDLVAVGEKVVEVHRAHHRADIGHGDIENGHLQIGDLIRRARRRAPDRRPRHRPCR